MLFVTAHPLGFLLRAPWVNAEVLCAAVATYLMLALLGDFAYTLVAILVPSAFVLTVGSAPRRSMARFKALYLDLTPSQLRASVCPTAVDHTDAGCAVRIARSGRGDRGAQRSLVEQN